MSSHPISVFAHKECNRRDSRRNYSPPILIASRGFKRGGVRRQAAPSDRACQAQLIEVRWIVVGDSASEHKPFPRARRNFKPLQLADHFERSVLASHLSAGSYMLPAQEPVHELRRGDRGDLLAQRRDRQTMNASQQTALAPLGLVFVRSGCICGEEFAAQNCSAGLHAEKRLFSLGGRQSQPLANFRRGGWA